MKLHKYLSEQGKNLVLEYSVRKGKKCPEEIEDLFKAMEIGLDRLNKEV